jgi:hypothetical protein
MRILTIAAKGLAIVCLPGGVLLLGVWLLQWRRERERDARWN